MAEDDERLRPLADRFRGMKPPRFPTMFEAVINAFACQQLSLEVGLELLNRLAAIAGATFRRPQDIHYAFPTAQDVARLTPAKAGRLGSAIKRSAHFSPSPARSPEEKWISKSSSREMTPRCSRACSSYVASAAGQPNTCCSEVWAASTCSQATMWALKSGWAGGSGVRGRWTTLACSARSNDGAHAGLVVYFHLLLDGLSQAGALDSTPSAR